MLPFWLLLIAVQCTMLFIFWRGARERILESKKPVAPPAGPRPAGLREDPTPAGPRPAGLREDPTPAVSMIIPVAGQRPYMRRALRSLMVQDYPRLVTIMVTATVDDPAVELIHELQKDFPQLRHVVAGRAVDCGQKNWNILQAVETIQDQTDIFVFCDSTHYAQPDFVHQLILPIVRQEAAFTTGYHAVDVQDHQLVSLGYQLSVLLMRFLQALSAFTQPWGGAMAISQQAFVRHGIAKFWRDKVVDDCSLAHFLIRENVHVQLCAHAVLRTPARNHPMPVWHLWMMRQVLFLKFCIFGQWLLLGVFALLMSLPLAGSALVLFGALVGLAPDWTYWAVLAHVILLMAILLGWRECLPRPVPIFMWFAAFIVSMYQFLRVYLATVPARGIMWSGIYYRVGRGGKVLSLQRPEE